MLVINPYLNFNGNCEQAFDFYKSVFGGEFLSKSRFKDGPKDNPVAPGEAEKILHVSLPIGKTNILMGSDCPSAWGKVSMGSNFSISVHPDSEKAATKLFNALAVGGKILMPLQKMFWGAYFGMCVDQFGIQWMVNFEYGAAQ